MKVLVPAKINTLLQVLQLRDDGYHEIYNHIVPISLYDILEVETRRQGGICFEAKGMNLKEEPEKNLVFKAAHLFQERTGIAINLDIRLEKKIPVGAGLGGGSADAAAILHVLNRLQGEPFSEEDLKKISIKLGADVPFFISPRPSEVMGIGEIIRPLVGYPLMPLVVLKPSFSISTAEAFQECIPKFTQSTPNISDPKELAVQLENRFEYTLFKKFPELNQLKTLCLQVGALGASVSGSGSAIFALFETEFDQMDAVQKLKRISQAEIYPCKMLNTHSFAPV